MVETGTQDIGAHVDFVPAVLYRARTDAIGTTIYVNDYIHAMLGFTPAEWLARPARWSEQIHPDDRDRASAMYAALNPGDPPTAYEYRIRHHDGHYLWVRDYARAVRGDTADLVELQGVLIDISRERALSENLGRSEQRYRELFQAHPGPMWIYDLETLRFLAVNDAAVRHYGYGRDEFLGMTIKDIRPPEDVPRLLENVSAVTEGEDEAGIWRHVKKNGTVIEVEITSHTLDYLGRRAEAVSARDVTEEYRARRQVRDYVARIEAAIFDTADAVAKIVELRDPYTAGHERRVGELAVAIAAQMGLDTHVQHGLRVAGALHDVGKVVVPSEILTKPTRLTEAEYKIIQAHPAAGYEVLKNIEFPWPVADVALQHHERMDGSGYPAGLRGEQILLEARIMAVADVIEAITSDRPYRAGLGIDAALAEIELHRGAWYDASVADAALRLFRVVGYRMPA